jgi:ATP-binding cassette subfamily F protein 3
MASQTAPKFPAGDRRDLTKTQARLEKQVARAEAEIAEHEAKIKERDQMLADPAVYQEFSKWNGLHQEQDTWKQELERLTARWESLSLDLADVKQKLAAIA